VCIYKFSSQYRDACKTKEIKKWDSSECSVPFWARVTQVHQARYSRTRKYNIKMNVKKILLEVMDWIDLVYKEKWWADLKAGMVRWISQNAGNFLTG
jgi:hypothetical protein